MCLGVAISWICCPCWRGGLDGTFYVSLETYHSGDALVLKRKYNLEKRSKWQYWNIFQWALKIWEIAAIFISLYWKHQEKTLSIIDCYQYMEL